MPKTQGKKATAADAEIVMRLYELRREPEMRKARKFFGELQLNTMDDFRKYMDFTTQENAWIRMVTSYWENAAALVLRGAVNRDLFLDWNGEMLFIYLKVKPILKGVREVSPEFMLKTETVLTSTPELRKVLAEREVRMKKWMEMQKAAAAGKR